MALNHERAEEEKRGLIRWLRPEFQNPQGVRAETQARLAEAGLEVPDETEAAATEKAGKGKKGAKATKAPWPKDLPARVVAVRDLLAEQGEARAADLTFRFKGVKAEEGSKLLESLAAVGVALETTPGAGTPQGPTPGVERTWAFARSS